MGTQRINAHTEAAVSLESPALFSPESSQWLLPIKKSVAEKPTMTHGPRVGKLLAVRATSIPAPRRAGFDLGASSEIPQGLSWLGVRALPLLKLFFKTHPSSTSVNTGLESE